MTPVRTTYSCEKHFQTSRVLSRYLANTCSAEDERSIGNRLNAAKAQNEGDDPKGKKLDDENELAKEDPTAPAKSHGNEPSKGAKIDKSIQDEEEEMIRKKDEAKAQSKAAKH